MSITRGNAQPGTTAGEIIEFHDTGMRVRKPDLMKQARIMRGLPATPTPAPKPTPPKAQFSKLPTVTSDKAYLKARSVLNEATRKRASYETQLTQAEAEARSASVRFELGECSEQELQRAEERVNRLQRHGIQPLRQAENEALARLHRAHEAALDRVAKAWREEEQEIVTAWSTHLEQLAALRERHEALTREWRAAGAFSEVPFDPTGPARQRGRLQGQHGIGLVKLTLTAALDAWKASVRKLGYRV